MTATIPTVTAQLTLTALDPIHHGAGTSGNTALLRTQDIVLADGRTVSVPYVSGNSIRHRLRDALAWHLVRTLGLGEGALTVGQVALLWSGGALSEPGAKVNVDRLRRVGQLLPHLMLMGYSAGNDIVTSTLRVTNAHLVCAENVWRLPAALRTHPHAGKPAGAFRDEAFGTRHDPTGGPTDQLLAESGMFDSPKSGTPTQMIYDFQVIRAGSILTTSLTLEAGTQLHLDSLACALAHATPDSTLTLGAKGAVGYGRCSISVDAPADAFTAERVERYTQHVATNADAIKALLSELVP